MASGLTPRQQEMLTFLKRFLQRRGYPPTLREIAAHFGFQGPQGARKHLDALERKGMIRRSRGNSRAIEIAGEQSSRTVRVPLLGRIPAGPLDLATEAFEETVEIDPFLARGKELFLLQVTGDSMIGAHICDGDYALIRVQSTAENGEIVAVRVGDRATLKRFYRDGKTLRLQAENPAMKPIILREGDRDGEVAIVGKVVAVLRRIGK